MRLPEWASVRDLFDRFRGFLPHRFDTGRIDSYEELINFTGSRAAFVAQTSLYGYLKTRMGTRYPQLFQDDVFVEAINLAKWRVYAACLSDLVVFATGHSARDGGLSDEEASALASQCFATVLEREFTAPEATAARDDAASAFRTRLQWTDWAAAADGETAFSQSPIDLVKWAPVTEEFKVEDQEIVMNSIRFRWRDVREQWRKRADGTTIAADWRARAGSP